jgi:2-polyprenyl-3-methyl-5-hydroxy-6-metoxy-1,4-benzoquinol methylase
VTTTQQAPAPEFDQTRMFSFYGRLMEDMAGAMVGVLCALGDRLGLFAALAAGPATSAELAERAGVGERYARDWLNALATRGYLEYDPGAERYSMPPEHAPALAQEGGPFFLGGAFQQLPGLVGAYEQILDAFRAGSGVDPGAYGAEMQSAMERTSASWFEHQLVPEWIEAIPGLRERLESGAEAADVGCGAGRALITLGRAFPNSRFVGIDRFEPALERARRHAAEAGVEGHVGFEVRDAVEGLPGEYDLITMFDVLHDIAEPQAVVAAVRRALRDDGVFFLLEINSAERPEENTGPIGALMYATSVLYCLPTSLATGGPGLGTLGLPESRVRELCTAAGFTSVRRLPVSNPFHALYEIRPL